MRAIVIITTIATTMAIAIAADFPANPGFEADGGWYAIGDHAPANFENHPGAAGKRCLEVQGWVVSEPDTTAATGGWLKVTLAAQPVGGPQCAANLVRDVPLSEEDDE